MKRPEYSAKSVAFGHSLRYNQGDNARDSLSYRDCLTQRWRMETSTNVVDIRVEMAL
jgi:hypothetical protein